MSDSHAKVGPDANGIMTLFLRGDWSLEMESALSNDGWDKLVLFGVTWPNYEPLISFVERIRRLVVPLGPDSSIGLERLEELEELSLSDVPKPYADFRAFRKLKLLKLLWSKNWPAQFIANDNLVEIRIDSVGGHDLEWLAPMKNLTSIALPNLKVQTLTGIEKFKQLHSLWISPAKKLTTLDGLQALTELRRLEVNAPKVTLNNILWIGHMQHLERLMLTSPIDEIDWEFLGKKSGLDSIQLYATSGYAAPDEEIIAKLTSAGRKIRTFKRFSAKTPNFLIELMD